MSGRASSDKGAAEELVETFEDWIKEHHDEYVALKAYFEQPYGQRPSLDDIKDAGQGPPGAAAT